MTDRNLEEAIFQLQKLNTENGVKQLVEEAAQLFSNGRHMEASALMEKAEAMISHPGKAPVAPPERAKTNDAPKIEAQRMDAVKMDPPKIDAPKMDEQAVAGMAGKLADGLSRILTGAFQELERHILGESRKLSNSFEQQLERLRFSIESLSQLQSKFEHLTEAVSEQKALGATIGQKHEQLSGAVTSLQESSTRHETEMGALRGETVAMRAETGALRGETTALRGETTALRGEATAFQGEAKALRGEAVALRGEATALRSEAKQFSNAVQQQMDGIAARLTLQQEEIGGMKGTVSDISRKVGGFIERVDRQADVIRSLSETQVRRAVALEELLGVLTRLKAPAEPLVAAAVAGQL